MRNDEDDVMVISDNVNNTGKSKEGPQTKENEERPPGKKDLLRPIVVSLKDCLENIIDITDPYSDGNLEVTTLCSEARKMKGLLDDLISTILKPEKGKRAADASEKQYQYVAKIQGLRQQHFKDMRNILQNALGLGTVKFSPPVRNSPFIEINFTTEELMTKGLRIVRDKPLGLTLCVVETRKVSKNRLPPEVVLDTVDAECDPIIMYKESLLRSRELTEEEYNRLVEGKEKFIKHILLKMCEKLDPDITIVMKNRTDGYYFKLEKIRASVLSSTVSERFQTYSGVNPDTGRVEMGYWSCGSDVPSRYPRTESIRSVLKVLVDFMESSGKPFFDLRVRKGYWDSVMIRSNHLGECMVVLVVHSESNSGAEKDVEKLKPLLKEVFETGDGMDCMVKSIHLKTHIESQDEGLESRRTAKPGTWTLVYGDEHLDEEVAGLRVRLFKNTFFWGDGGCTEQLCETVADQLELHSRCGVLEMGVATGLICMYLARRCKIVVGLDRMQSVLPSARKNVELNDLENVTLVQGSGNITVGSLKSRFNNCDNVYAVITETSSNARSRDEILGLRKAPWIKKVAYLIISYKDVTHSLKLLCSKIVDSSDPFVIVKVIPFDVVSTSVRPDILLLLERASALDGLTERRVPKTKPKPLQPSGPPSKRAKMAPGPQVPAQHLRPLLADRQLGPPPQMMQGNKGFGGRGFQNQRQGFHQNQMPNQGYGPQRENLFPWTQNDHPRGPSQFDSGMANSVRLEEEEAMLLERMRRQKEVQLQQIQAAVLQQQRRLAESLITPTAVPNIEEVVLSAIKKTGLLEKVSALTDTPSKQMEVGSSRSGVGGSSSVGGDNWSRFNEPQTDRWQSSYDRISGDNRSPGNDDISGYRGRDNTAGGYQGRDNQIFMDRDSSGYQGRDNSRFQDASGFQDRDNTGIQDRDTFSYRDTSTFQNRDYGGDNMYNRGGGSFNNNSDY